MKVRKDPESTNYYAKNRIVRKKRYYQLKEDNPEKMATYYERYRLKIRKLLEGIPSEKETKINLLSDEFIISLIKKIYDI